MNRGEPWHLDKKVPLAIITALILQSGSFIWYLSGQEARVEDAHRRVIALETYREQTVNRQTAEAAARAAEQARIQEAIARLGAQQEGIIRALTRVEALLDRGGNNR